MQFAWQMLKQVTQANDLKFTTLLLAARILEQHPRSPEHLILQVRHFLLAYQALYVCPKHCCISF